jgi:glycosyltransferase involved in cell wall biosynthesis
VKDAHGVAVASRRIFYVVNSFEYFMAHRMSLAEAMTAAGCEVHIVAPHSPNMTHMKSKGITCHVVRMNRRSINIFRELLAFMDIFRVYAKYRPKLVHHITSKPVLYGGIAARLLGIPAVVGSISGLGYVFMSNSAKARMLRYLVMPGYKIALHHENSRAIFENTDDLEIFERNGLIEEHQSIVIKGVGVDLAEYAAHDEEKNKVSVVVLASRMLWDKGIGEFVEAAQSLKLEGVQARFILVGNVDPDNPSAISVQQLKNWSAEGNVEWWGLRNDMPEVLRQANLVCLPSYREGVPRVLLEAAACGRAVVTTDVPGCREVVRHGENGFLVPARDAGALAAAIRSLVADPVLRQHMGRRGREIAVTEFSVEKVVMETLAIYRQISERMAAQ